MDVCGWLDRATHELVVETQGAEAMSKHTPGPWAWGNFCEEVGAGAKDAMELVAYGPEDSKGMRPIYQILDIGEDGKVASAENGRLIACAPELLEACKYMLDYCPAGLMQSLEAVIAKAEGTTANAPAAPKRQETAS